MRVLIADDSLLIRDGLASLLRENGIEVVAQTDSVDGLLAKIAGHRPDVAIIDIRMPPTHTDEGLRAAAEIRARYPEVGILILSQHVESRPVYSPSPRPGSATCSRTGSPTSKTSLPRYGVSPAAGPSSIPKSSPNSSPGAVTVTIRSRN